MRGVNLLVIQPTPFCNINCSYCYLPDRNNKRKITALIVEKIITRLLQDKLIDKELSIVWHAGEPMVLPPDFYRPLFDLFRIRLSPLGISIHHSIQTNGTLISQDWCDFIKEYEIKIGISIDGPQPLQDEHRKRRNGQGTFESVMNGLSLLQANHIPYHGIAVVSQKSLTDPESLFSFFYDNGFYELGLNIEEVEGVHSESSVFPEVLSDKVAHFYSCLFDKYIQSDKHLRIREFERSFKAIMRNPETIDITRLSAETHQNRPMAIISVDHEGNFSSFSPELIGQKIPQYNNFIFGNVLETSFLKPGHKDLLDEVTKAIDNGIKKCKKECAFFYVCGGGAPANKFFENGTFNSSETNYCKYTIKIPAELVLSYLEKTLQII